MNDSSVPNAVNSLDKLETAGYSTIALIVSGVMVAGMIGCVNTYRKRGGNPQPTCTNNLNVTVHAGSAAATSLGAELQRLFYSLGCGNSQPTKVNVTINAEPAAATTGGPAEVLSPLLEESGNSQPSGLNGDVCVDVGDINSMAATSGANTAQPPTRPMPSTEVQPLVLNRGITIEEVLLWVSENFGGSGFDNFVKSLPGTSESRLISKDIQAAKPRQILKEHSLPERNMKVLEYWAERCPAECTVAKIKMTLGQVYRNDLVRMIAERFPASDEEVNKSITDVLLLVSDEFGSSGFQNFVKSLPGGSRLDRKAIENAVYGLVDSHSLGDQNMAVLEYWKERNIDSCNVQCIYETLKKRDLNDLAKKVKDKFCESVRPPSQ